MIVDNGRYYLYRHIRLDKNEVFYVGIGTKNTKYAKGFNSLYQRAFNINTRNKIWKDIYIKNENYKVEIVMESDDYKFLLIKEVEFVKLYGRINLGTGTLSNLTDGGDSPENVVISPETKIKMSLNHRDRGKFGVDNSKSKKIYQYDLEGNFIKEFIGIREASRVLNISPASITSCLMGKSNSCVNSMWFYEYKGDNIKPFEKSSNNKRSILMVDKSGNLKEFSSVTEAANYVNTDPATITRVCKGRAKTAKGYRWKYK